MEEFESPPLWVLVTTYYNYIVMTVFGYFRDLLRKYDIEKNCAAQELPKVRNFPVLYDSFAGFYTRNCYMRVRDVFNRPIQENGNILHIIYLSLEFFKGWAGNKEPQKGHK